MSTRRLSLQIAVGMCITATLGSAATSIGTRAATEAAKKDSVVFSSSLPNVPGKAITAVVVNYAPGGASPAHQHAGSVLAYVLSGTIRSENSATGPVRVYKAGETFFEPAGSTHLVSENGSQTEPASLLAIFVADEGAQLTHGAK
jgi:quercetin dioxygenase-like cupin family protein